MKSIIDLKHGGSNKKRVKVHRDRQACSIFVMDRMHTEGITKFLIHYWKSMYYEGLYCENKDK